MGSMLKFRGLKKKSSSISGWGRIEQQERKRRRRIGEEERGASGGRRLFG